MIIAPLIDPIARMRTHRRLRNAGKLDSPTPNTRTTMKLYNVIHVWDVYVVAESEDAALEAAHKAILAAEDPQPYEECTAIEIRDQKGLRERWLNAKPIVGDDVADDDFAKLKGKTTAQVFDLLHSGVVEPKSAVAPKPPKKAGK